MKRLLLSTIVLAACLMPQISHATVHIVLADNFFYAPSSLTIDEGDTVRFQWVNGNHPTSSTTGDWSSPVTFPLDAGNTSNDLVFPDAGVYDYQCDFHVFLGMVGTITVNASGSTCSASTTPTGLTATDVAGGVLLSFDPIPGAIRCRITGGEVGGPSGQLLVNVPPYEATVPCAFLDPMVLYSAEVQCACQLTPTVIATNVSASVTFSPGSCPILREASVDELNVYPVPADQSLNFRYYPSESGDVAFELTDLSGRVVLSQNLQADAGSTLESQFNTSDLAAGSYVLLITQNEITLSRNVQVSR
jgi:plastocyanin